MNLLTCFFFVTLSVCGAVRTAGAVGLTATNGDALSAVTHEACHRQVVMLGESSTHGDGHTEAFKVALVERLVEECGFDQVIFEANHAEFIHLARRIRAGEPVGNEDLSSAVGGLWKFDQEFQPLVPFLLAKAKAGDISLGGLDDQLGLIGQDYVNIEMVKELTGYLSTERQAECRVALHHRIYSDYSESAPYSATDHLQIAACLSEMGATVASDRAADRVETRERLEMISATQRWIDRDFASDAEGIVGRDRSMFANFLWLRDQEPKRHKVLLWAATVHIAKQGDPTWGDRKGTNFGSYVHRKYHQRAYSLGFSALRGTYREGRRKISDMPIAPADSIEASTMSANSPDAVALGSKQLAQFEPAPGAIFRHSFQILRWSEFVDGVVIFRQEQPPTEIKGR